MSSYKINISKTSQPHTMALLLKKRKIKRGDKVKLVTDEQLTQTSVMWALIIFVIALVPLLDRKRKTEDAAKLLDDLFKDYKSPQELEAQIKKEYNVMVEVEQGTDEERQFWQEVSAKGMANAYDKNEPDISDLKLLEPNPKYKPWKKAQ